MSKEENRKATLPFDKTLKVPGALNLMHAIHSAKF